MEDGVVAQAEDPGERVGPRREHEQVAGLVIAYDMSVESNQQDQSPDRRAYRRSYSFSRGTTSRRIALPADAKLDALSREVSENRIILRIPRDASPSGGYR